MGGRLSTDTDTPAPPAPPAPPARVVVVGASFAGLALTRQLLASGAPCDVTVVEPKDYFEYTPGVLRCFVAPEKAEGLLVPLPK
jgi:NADPH-dependent 2,4-dienoyl-CoA reductase/sulfur reductase-like enzyme